MKTNLKFGFVGVIGALLLSACAGATPTAAPAATVAATEAVAPTEVAATEAPMEAAATEAPAVEATAIVTATEAMTMTEAMTPTMEMTATAAMTTAAAMTETAAPLVLDKQFKIAIVMPSATTDAAFSQSMFEALKAVQAEVGGEDKLLIAFSENMFNVPDAAAALRDYASQGFDLIIAHGTQYGTSLAEIAPDFPETSFAWGTATDTMDSKGLKNVFAYQADAQQGGYVLGVLAALTSKSGIIGVSGPVEAGDAKLYVDGFKKGAEAAKPGIKVNVSYTGSFSDISKMTAAAETHVAAGADMLTGSSQSVVGAIGIAKDKKLLWFGTQWDQTSLAPEAVAVSQVYDWTAIVKELISSHVAGTLGGKAFTLTLANGGLKLVYNDKVTLPPEAKAAAEKAVADIEAGTVTP